jgi:hypothetical protein
MIISSRHKLKPKKNSFSGTVLTAIGQALRATKAKDFYTQNSKALKRLQEVSFNEASWNLI